MQPFDLQVPRSLEDALALLPKERSYAGAQLIAGGQDILTVMKNDIAAPTALVELDGLIPGEIEDDGAGGLVLGATATIQEIADSGLVQERLPSLAEAAKSIASPQIRSRATVGGNLHQRPRCPYFRHSGVSCFKKGGNGCLAEFGFNKYAAILGGGPSYFSHPSDMATALIGVGASVEIAGADGATRTVALDEYYVLPDEALDRETVLGANEAVTRIVVPAPTAGARTTYLKFKERESYDFALAAASVSVVLDGDKVASARVVLGGVATKPWPSPEAEAALVGKTMGPDAWRAAGEAAVADAVPRDMNGYKLHLVKGVLFRALESLV